MCIANAAFGPFLGPRVNDRFCYKASHNRSLLDLLLNPFILHMSFIMC